MITDCYVIVQLNVIVCGFNEGSSPIIQTIYAEKLRSSVGSNIVERRR